jgi:hypothetical protein
MRDAFVDVTLELPITELSTVTNPSNFVLEKMRDEADRLCDEAKARLRTDRAPEIQVNQAIEARTGRTMLLCASRWAVEVPETLEVASG